MKTIRKLCSPAYVYLVISVIAIVTMMIQNGGNHDRFCLGSYECGVENTAAVFLVQGLYSVFWVFLLDCVCKAGHKNISWFLVLFPYILMFILLGFFVLESGKEGFNTYNRPQSQSPRKRCDDRDRHRKCPPNNKLSRYHDGNSVNNGNSEQGSTLSL